MGVQCQILLKGAKEGVFKSGEFVSGTVKYHLDKATKFESIDISFIGKGKCHWSETNSDDSTTYYKNKEDYVLQHKNILRPGNSEPVKQGTYNHPFEFFIPEKIPTSVKNKICTIEYKIVVKFVKASFFSRTEKFDAEIPVYGLVSPCSPEPLTFGLKKDLFSLGSENCVNIKGVIDKTTVTPGENINVTLTIHNDSNVPVHIKSELIKHFTYVSSSKRKNIQIEKLKTTKGYSPDLKNNTVSKYSCIVPTLDSLYSIQNTKILVGEFRVKITAKFPFPHINASVEVPVVIGESRNVQGVTILDEKPSSSEIPEKFDKSIEANSDFGIVNHVGWKYDANI